MSKHIIRAVLGLLVFTMSQNKSFGTDDESLSKLRSPDPQERSSASQEIIKQRTEKIAALESLLLEFVNTPERKGTVGSVMILLGDLRSEHSVPLLLKHLTFAAFYKDVKRPQPIDDLYPAAGALAKIGIVAVDPLLASASQTDDDDYLRVSGFALRKILGDNLAKARIDLEASKSTNDSVRRRVAKILAYASGE